MLCNHEGCEPNLLLESLEEVDICKLFHLINVHRFHHFLVVEEHPAFRLFLVHKLPDECHIMSKPLAERVQALSGLAHAYPA